MFRASDEPCSASVASYSAMLGPPPSARRSAGWRRRRGGSRRCVRTSEGLRPRRPAAEPGDPEAGHPSSEVIRRAVECRCRRVSDSPPVADAPFAKNVASRLRPRATEGEGAVPREALPLPADIEVLDPADLLADEVAVVAVEADRTP
jgi:hypothetical protein